ncbi:MAG: AsnC family protein, partial [Pseudomonadota bacterium]
MKISSKTILIKLDRIDKNIIRHLQDNGRIQNNDLAREIGLSPSSCLRRVKLLEEAVRKTFNKINYASYKSMISNKLMATESLSYFKFILK